MQLISLHSESLIRCHGRFLTGIVPVRYFVFAGLSRAYRLSRLPPEYIFTLHYHSYIHTFHFCLCTGVTTSPRVLLSNLGVFLHWLLGFPELDLHSVSLPLSPPPYRVQQSVTALPFFGQPGKSLILCCGFPIGVSPKVHSIPIIHWETGPRKVPLSQLSIPNCQ